MGHGQYLVYSSKSSTFEECIISGFGNIANIIVFQAPAQFPKTKDVSNTTFHDGKIWL